MDLSVSHRNLCSVSLCTVSALTLTVIDIIWCQIFCWLQSHCETTQENHSNLIAVKKKHQNRIKSLDALLVYVSVVLITRSDAICRYALSATLATGHRLPGVLFWGASHIGAAAVMTVHMWPSWKQESGSDLVCSHHLKDTTLRPACRGWWCLITNKLIWNRSSLVAVQQAAALSVHSTCTLMLIHVIKSDSLKCF